MEYYVIGDEDTVLGFGMVGVRGRQVETEREASYALDSALEDTEIGILIMTERVADLVRERVDYLLFSEDFPLVVEIPDRAGKVANRPSLRETVNNAIGIQV